MGQEVSQKKAWLMVTLLFFFIFINFADKLVIGLAAGPIMRDLGLSPSQFGYVVSSFFFLFSISALLTGFIVNHVKTKYVLTAMALIWAVAQFSVMGAASFGVLGLVWVALWLLLGEEGPIADPIVAEIPGEAEWPRVSYGRLLTSRTFIGSVCCGFAAYWSVTLVVSWVPSFLSKGLGYEAQSAAWLVSLISASAAGFSFLVGWGSQVMLQRQLSSRVARALLTGAFAASAGLCLCIMTYLPNSPVKIGFLVVGLALTNGIYPLIFAMVGEIVPTRQRGAALSILSAIFTTAGLVAPTVIGYAVELGATPEAGFNDGFLITSAIL